MYHSTAFKFVPIDGRLNNYVVRVILTKMHKEKVVLKNTRHALLQAFMETWTMKCELSSVP